MTRPVQMLPYRCDCGGVLFVPAEPWREPWCTDCLRIDDEIENQHDVTDCEAEACEWCELLGVTA